MRTVKLTTTQDQWEHLNEASDKARKTAKVNAAALSALLMDHSKLLQLHKGDVVDVQ